MRRPVLLLLLAALLAALSACAGTVERDAIRSAEGAITGLTVTGTPGTAPVVRMAAPLKVSRTRTDVVVRGTGAPIQVDQLFVLQVTLYDARTGDRVLSTYDDGQQPLVAKSSDDTLFPALTKALVGQPQGSRVVLALTAEDAYAGGATPPEGVRADDPVVLVADVVAVPPTDVLAAPDGDAVPARADDPQVVEQEGDPSRLTFPRSDAPTRVTVVPLVQGDGPKVRDHSLVDVDYLAQAWGSPAPYASTYFKEPALVAIGARTSNPTWDEALVGIRRGSRVLVVGPPGEVAGDGAGRVGNNAPTAWVVDVLGVS